MRGANAFSSSTQGRSVKSLEGHWDHVAESLELDTISSFWTSHVIYMLQRPENRYLSRFGSIVRICDNAKQEDELFEDEFSNPLEHLFQDHEAPHDVVMNEEEASVPDADELIEDEILSHEPEG